VASGKDGERKKERQGEERKKQNRKEDKKEENDNNYGRSPVRGPS
jgi:hypothetical protein